MCRHETHLLHDDVSIDASGLVDFLMLNVYVNLHSMETMKWAVKVAFLGNIFSVFLTVLEFCFIHEAVAHKLFFSFTPFV